MLRFSIAILCGLAVAGCQSGRNAQSPPEARGVILANRVLLWHDPESIQNASIAAPQFKAGTTWRVCVRLNTKNGFGGSTGERDYLVELHQAPNPPTLVMEDASQTCAGQPHTPFPELEGGYRQLPLKPKEGGQQAR